MKYSAPEAEVVSFDNGYLVAVASGTNPSPALGPNPGTAVE